MKKINLIIILLFVSGIVNAQFKIEKHFDKDERDVFNHYEVLLVTPNEVVVTYEKYASGNMLEIHFERYDTAFQLISDKSIKIPYPLLNSMIKSSFGTAGYMFYHDFDGNFALITYDVQANSLKKITGKIPKNYKEKELIPTGKVVYLAGYAKDKNTLVTLNPETGFSTLLNLPFKEVRAAYYRGHQFQKSTGNILLYYLAFPTGKSSDVLVVQADNQGNVKGALNTSDQVDQLILSERVMQENSDKGFMVGAYSQNTRFFPEGIFWQSIDSLKITKPSLLPFNNIESFADEARKQNKKVKQDLILASLFPGVSEEDYNLIMHEPIKLDDTYIVVGEFYYNTFDSDFDKTNTSNMIKVNTYFNGFQYTHGIVLKINTKGELIWSKVFPAFIKGRPYYDMSTTHNFNFNPPVPYTLIHTSEISSSEIPLIYISANKIIRKTYTQEGVIKEESENIWAEDFMADKNDILLNAQLFYWYGNNYLSVGSIENKKKKSDEFLGQFIMEKVKF